MKELEKNLVLDEKKLWIGNLDPRVTEYQLLKLVQTHGTIEKFDLIFHRSGPLAGQPRGYAFVSYVRKEDAVRAKNNLNGKMIGQKKVTVTWAHGAEERFVVNKRGSSLQCIAIQLNSADVAGISILLFNFLGICHIWVIAAKLSKEDSSNSKSKPDITIPALALSKDSTKTDPVSQIQAIEAKLRLMEQKNDELKINDSIATKPPVIQQFQFNKDRNNSLKTKQFHLRMHDRHRKPYIKRKPKN